MIKRQIKATSDMQISRDADGTLTMEPFHQTQRQPILAASQVAPASFSLFNALHKVEPSKKVKVLRDLTPNVNKLWLVVKQIAGANP